MLIGITEVRARLNSELVNLTFTFCEKDVRILFYYHSGQFALIECQATSWRSYSELFGVLNYTQHSSENNKKSSFLDECAVHYRWTYLQFSLICEHPERCPLTSNATASFLNQISTQNNQNRRDGVCVCKTDEAVLPNTIWNLLCQISGNLDISAGDLWICYELYYLTEIMQ